MDATQQPHYGIKPVIEEIIRTQVCFANIRLEVERISIVPVPTSDEAEEKQAFRLRLSDGEKSILGNFAGFSRSTRYEWLIEGLALVKRRLHRSVFDVGVRRGTVVVLKEYQLARAKRLNGEGEVAYVLQGWRVGQGSGLMRCVYRYFAISDFFVVVHQKVESSGEEAKIEDYSHQDQQNPLPVEIEDEKGKQPSPQLQDEGGQEPRVEDSIVPRCPEWIQQASYEHHLRCHMKETIPEDQRCPATDDESFWKYYDDHLSPVKERPCASISNNALRAIMADSPLTPFRASPKIVSLVSVTGRHKSRNQDVDVLAVIESIDASTTKPARLPLKRDIRIRDPSVDEAVTLSVFIDPENFHSSIGTVALFRHVTTHDWRRGNLNAYPARVNGREWFIPTPYCLGFEQDVRNLEQWWEGQRSRGNAAADDV